MREKLWGIAPIVLGIAFFLLFVALIAFGVWFHYAAPCSFVSRFTTLHDLPARCLVFVR
jgi:hypothetical protein